MVVCTMQKEKKRKEKKDDIGFSNSLKQTGRKIW
jgi:hypothetical protein